MLFLAVLGLVALLLSSCSSSEGRSLAKQACTYVNQSISNYNKGSKSKNPQIQHQYLNKAYVELRAAEPLAAAAAGDDPTWQALATTVSESSRVPEKYLIHALIDECTAVNSES